MSTVRVRSESSPREIEASFSEDTLRWTSGTESGTCRAIRAADGEWLLEAEDGRRRRAVVAQAGSQWWVHVDGRTHVVGRASTAPASRAGGAGGPIVAPMTGRVLEVLVAEGAAVRAGDVLAVLSAMKMQLEIAATADGIVRRVLHAAGDQVEGGTVLVIVEPEPERAHVSSPESAP